jgi:hypothetical protein
MRRTPLRFDAAAVPTWNAVETLPLEARTLRVLGVRGDDADQPPVLVVDDTPRIRRLAPLAELP